MSGVRRYRASNFADESKNFITVTADDSDEIERMRIAFKKLAKKLVDDSSIIEKAREIIQDENEVFFYSPQNQEITLKYEDGIIEAYVKGKKCTEEEIWK